MDIIQILKDELQINRSQVEAAVKLIDEGNPSRLSPVTAKKRQAL